jgi:hypothetical protein
MDFLRWSPPALVLMHEPRRASAYGEVPLFRKATPGGRCIFRPRESGSAGAVGTMRRAETAVQPDFRTRRDDERRLVVVQGVSIPNRLKSALKNVFTESKAAVP